MNDTDTERKMPPEHVTYSHYYEHDGALRAYANRSMALAAAMGLIAFVATGFAIYVRLMPPTVIHVAADGTATVVGGTPGPGRSHGLAFVASAAETGPSELEAKAEVRRFLDLYLNFTPATADRQIAEACNLMTGNLANFTLTQLRSNDTINKIQDDNIVSNFKIRSIEPLRGQPLTYTAYGVKEIHRVRGKSESTDQIVGRYDIRLVAVPRSEINPSGLLVAQYWEQQMVGDKNTAMSQNDPLSGEAAPQ